MEKIFEEEHGLPLEKEAVCISTEASGERDVPVRIQTNTVLMDWEKGLVGWESSSDSANPL
jgi:hypothetical protein